MAKKKTNNLYPIKVKIELYVTDGKQDGVLSGMENLAHFPTHEDVLAACMDAATKLPPGFRLMTPDEVWTFAAEEKGIKGIHIASGSREWLHQADIDSAWQKGLAKLSGPTNG